MTSKALRLMVYLARAGLFTGSAGFVWAEENDSGALAKALKDSPVADPKTGAIAKAEKISDPDDLKAATAQKAAMAKATVSLLAATDTAVKANAGLRAVSVYPQLQNGHPVAEVTLLQGTVFKKLTEKLD